jgi:hypothetical protein
MLPGALTLALIATPVRSQEGDERLSPAPRAADGSGESAAAALEVVRLPAGTALHEVSSPVARVLARLEEAADLPVLDRSGTWVRVVAGEQSGWVDLAGVSDGAGGAETATVQGRETTGGDAAGAAAAAAASRGALDLLPTAGSAGELLAAVRAILGEAGHELSWGRFEVITDRPDHPLISLGERIAAALPDLHARRFGLVGGSPAAGEGGGGALVPHRLGTVVVLTRDADYRTVLASLAGEAARLDLAGNAGGGVAVLPIGGRTTGQAAGTLVHEIAHLLNQRALGTALPPWLDEGLAGDLELVDVGTRGELDDSRWAQGPPDQRGRRGRSGPVVVLDRLLADAGRGRLETFERLAALDRTTLVASPRRAELYALAALWVRFFLAEPERAAGFRRFLGTLSATEAAPADGGAALLAEALATDLGTLEAPFRRWLHDLARRF